ncbi:MAG: hypothetical protein ACF8PN_12420 [Phycisphaerales bacterium]
MPIASLFFEPPALWFTLPALFGTGLFVMKMALMLAAGDLFGAEDINGVVDLDFDTDLDGAMDGVDGDTADASTAAFNMLSLQSIAAFVMGFGWIGLGALRGQDFSVALSVVLGVLGGVAMVYLLGRLLQQVYRLQANGVVSIESAVGLTGAVDVTVPERGAGRGMVRVVIDNRQRHYDAISDGPAIARHASVRIVGVNDDRSVRVQPV